VSRQNFQKGTFRGFSGFSVLLETSFLLQQEATTIFFGELKSSVTSGLFSCHKQERMVFTRANGKLLLALIYVIETVFSLRPMIH
jgi:hypothetical protein